ncbi:MAG: 50S ribosomal protein L21e [Candidatus Woesearchaeota archaeon]|nr:50S ribosomal protein L21e [Candidatus Woesearchaeota archaeon]
MVQRKGSRRRKTRHKLLKPLRSKGKMSVVKFLQQFKEGDKVVLKAEPGYQKGAYHFKFHGRFGIVTGQQGKCYTVAMSDQGKQKNLIVHPVHLKRL